MDEYLNGVVEKRRQFSEFYSEMLRKEELDGFIHGAFLIEPNQNSIFSFVYGGRAWNFTMNHFFGREIQYLEDFQRSAILDGNYDIVNIVPNNIELYNYRYKLTFANMKELVKRFNKVLLTDAPNYKAVLYYDKESMYKTITHGRGFRIYMERTPGFETRRGSSSVDIIDFGESKMLFYLELGLNDYINKDKLHKEYINVEHANQLMVYPGNMHLNWFGLIFMANITNLDRSKEKGFHIDDARLEIINKVLLPHIAKELFRDTMHGLGGSIHKNSNKSHKTKIILKHGSKKRNIIKEIRKRTSRAFMTPIMDVSRRRNTLRTTLKFSKNKYDSYLYIAFVLFPSIFDTNFLLYSFSQGVFLENLIKSSNVDIKSKLEKFNSDLLDSPGGNLSMSKMGTDLLSIRQLIILWVTKLEDSFKNQPSPTFRIQVAGGDVFRLYLPSIKTTSDLDFKLFYTNKTDEFPITRFILFITFIITFYLHINNYFRMTEHLYTERVGNYTFTRSIDTLKQDIIPSVRILPDFIVPLVSIDLNLNGFIECPKMSFGPTRYNRSKVVIPANRIKVVHSTAPLDISINHSKKLPDISNRPDRHCFPINESVLTLLHKHRDEITECDQNKLTIPSAITSDGSRIWCLPPNPDINYLYKDLKFIVDSNMRPQKKEKDTTRLRTIEDKIVRRDLAYDFNRLFDIEQFGCSESYRYSRLNDAIQNFLDALIRRNIHKKKINKSRFSDLLRDILNHFWAGLQMPNDVGVTPDFLVDVFNLPMKATTISEYQMPHSFMELLKDTNSPLYAVLMSQSEEARLISEKP